MNNPTAWQRFRYWFDNLMSKGTSSLLLVLGVITAIVVVAGGLASVALGGPDGTGAESPGSSIWFTLMHAINTGVLAKEEGTVPYLIVMTIVTLVGIFITSFLIGTISNGIKDKVTELQRGKSHIIEELALANRNQDDAVVVIMADADKTEMEDIIRDRVPDLGNMRVVCRTGRPDSPKDLKVCSLDTCKSIIVNLEDDFMTVKTILACESLLDELGNDEAFITATVLDRDVVQPAKIAGGERAEILNFQKTIARLMVQSGRHPGMSEILSELLSFEGNEIYVEEMPEAAGCSLQEVNRRLPHSTAIGMVRGETPMLNPAADALIEAGDQLIVIAHDDEASQLQEIAPVNEDAFQREASPAEEPSHLLILGCSDMLKPILIGQSANSAPGSKVVVAAEPGKLDESMLPRPEEMENLEVELRECKIFKRPVLESLVADWPTSIMLMADTTVDDETADAQTLMLQLQLTDIAQEIGTQIPLTIEMNSTRNQRLSQMMRATDFVVSSRVTAKMMVQIAEERHKKAIINDLLTDGGSAIYMKPITRYVTTGEPVDFYTLGASAARYGEIAIGYKRFAEDGSFEIEVNPRSKAAKTFTQADDLIVVAKG